MKKLAITIAAVFATLNIFAQGTVAFQNTGTSLVIDSTTGVAALGGTTFSVALYWSAQVAGQTTAPDPSTFVQVGPTIHVGILNPTTGLYIAGKYQGPTVTIAGITPPGGMGWFEVKGWSTAYGNTFEQAKATGLGLFGQSNYIDIPTGNPIPPPTTPHALTGLLPMLLIPVPEPAILGLGLLGGVAMLLLRRRK
jgi:hypothetical protein